MACGNYEVIIGLEIHAQLATQTKMFSPISTAFGRGDNENTSPICLGMPGTLPRINRAAVDMAIATGLALGCSIRNTSVFARKQYFYPDLPKGYQISQYDKPLCENGEVAFKLDGELKRISIERAHMEEDAGKSTHHGDYTLVNFNRAGIPLLEIVSGPDLRSPQEAAQYARTVRSILRYLGVCDGNLEEGSMRCDCNVSIRRKGETKFGTKVELKNINSFRFIEKALEFEIQRQIVLVEEGGKVVQETRLYDSVKNRTFSMRSKEEAHDYRYFPDPDLLPLEVSDEWIESVRAKLPELPLQRAARLMDQYGLPEYDADILTQERTMADYFEKVAELSGNAKAASNWIMGEVLRRLNDEKKEFQDLPLRESQLADMIKMIDSGKISGKMAKDIFAEMWGSGKSPQEIVDSKGLTQVTDSSAIEAWVDEVITNNPDNVNAYRSGKTKLFGFFVGQVLKLSKGQANPGLVNELLKKKLDGQ